MSHRIFAIVYILCFVNVFSAAAQNERQHNTLSGTVVDKKTNKPLPQASVTIPDLKIGVVADSNGHYFFASVPNGSFLIEAHSVGYATETRSIHVSGQAKQDFSLSDETIEEIGRAHV